MSTEIIMPALSPTMEYGTLARWLIKSGDHVSEGDIIAEIETDKATMELEASEAGFISDILVVDGSEDIAVGTPLARLTDQGTKPTKTAAPEKDAPPAAAPAPETLKAAPPAAKPVESIVAPPILTGTSNLSPVAKELAIRFGIDPKIVNGTGAGGQITRADILSHLPDDQRVETRVPIPAQTSASPSPISNPSLAPSQTGATSQPSMSIECDMRSLVRMRARINAAQAQSEDQKISIDAIMVRVLGRALAQAPELSGSEIIVGVSGKTGQGQVTAPERSGLSAIQAQIDATDAIGASNCRYDNHSHLGIRQSIPVCGPGEMLALSVGAYNGEPEPQDEAGPSSNTATITASFAPPIMAPDVSATILGHIKATIEKPERLYL